VKPDDVQRWTFMVPTPLGITQSTYELTHSGLQFTSDDPFSASETLSWASIRQGGTAAMAGMAGRGALDLPNWVPSQLEWLLLSRSEGGGKAFMRVLPQGGDRDAIVAALQARLGSAWIGARLPLKQAQQQLGIAEGAWSTLKVIGLVVAVMALLVLLVVVLALLLHPLILVPASLLLGGWLCRKGLTGLRDGQAVANTPTAKVAHAQPGLVELEGRAVTDEPSPAGITGRPSVWWDVSVSFYYDDSDNDGEWRQVAARHGGRVDLVELEDDSGRLPVWLPGATLLLESRGWESGQHGLPAPGLALLDELGFPWNGNRRILVNEECLEVGQTLYVLGTLDERRNLPEPAQAGIIDRGLQLVRSGQWRRALVGAVPPPLRIVVAVLIGYLDMLTQIGRGGERRPRDIVAAPPSMAPDARVVWKGAANHPFVVSNRAQSAALATLRQRSQWTVGIGVAVLCFTLYQLIEILRWG
jgi:hypothetical protein